MFANDRIQQFVVFLFAGFSSFLIESCTIYYFVEHLNSNPVLPRLFSYPTGLILIYYINRNYGFRLTDKANIKEFLRFLKINLLTISTNTLLYLFFVNYITYLENYPVLALLIATSVSMIISFIYYRIYVFTKNNN